jgi:acyl carrier protein
MVLPLSESDQIARISAELIEVWSDIVPVAEPLSGIDTPRAPGRGDSLALLRFISKVEQRWQVQLSIREVFSDPQFDELAGIIATRRV